MDSELQIALIALGVAVVVGIIAYNKWQERKHRKHAESAFRSDHRDVLLEPQEQYGNSDDVPLDGTARMEPMLSVQDDELAEEGIGAPQPVRPTAVSGRKGPSGVPDGVDTRIDALIRVEVIESAPAERWWEVQKAQLEGLAREVRWYAFNDGSNLWEPLTAHSAGVHHWYCAAIQLVNRRGALTEAELQHFIEGVGNVANHFLAVPADEPSRAQTMQLAAEIDSFCASMDVQVGVNIVSRSQPFAGTKIRALAESNGMVLEEDGLFHAYDDDGGAQFTLANLEAPLFVAGEMRHLHTSGLTFVIDVPLVADGVVAFDRMMRVANQMAHALDGTVVDDNRAAIAPESATVIRSQIQRFQAQMREGGLPSGGALAKRLFSA